MTKNSGHSDASSARKLKGFGLQASARFSDPLDRRSIETISEMIENGLSVTALDLGGGIGTHSVLMAEAGASVTYIDRADTKIAYRSVRESAKFGKIDYDAVTLIRRDFLEITDNDIPDNLNILYSQRAIHYIPYDDAAALLTRIGDKMTPCGHIFISAAGYDTEYGKVHPDRDKPVNERFSPIPEFLREKYGLTQPIVIYREEELAGLLEQSGFTVAEKIHSSFGNVKIVGYKP